MPKDKTWESGFTLQFLKQMSLLEFATILIFYKSLSTVALQVPQDNVQQEVYWHLKLPRSHCWRFKSSNNFRKQGRLSQCSFIPGCGLCMFMFGRYLLTTLHFSPQCEPACFTRMLSTAFIYLCLPSTCIFTFNSRKEILSSTSFHW